MRLARLRVGQEVFLALVEGEVAVLLEDYRSERANPVLAMEEAGYQLRRKKGPSVPLEEAEFLPPVSCPSKILALGLNYRAHAREMDVPSSGPQIWFNKQVTALSAHRRPIVRPPGVTTLDYEGELVLVIGQELSGQISPDPLGCLLGVTVGNDVSVREWQWESPTWTLGKSYDTHAPVGPWIVTMDELGDLSDVLIRTLVNGELRQEASTADMTYGVTEMLSFLASRCRLLPGDLIFTGTPAGVGASRNPPAFLQDGDVVEVTAGGIGTLSNTVVSAA
jgi:2-keto-4-pentenoate hydratase/2-oxohepta-3-ene-1,7-dioic acid hydratase in catechol pathway